MKVSNNKDTVNACLLHNNNKQATENEDYNAMSFFSGMDEHIEKSPNL